jgi:hypothetical protein
VKHIKRWFASWRQRNRYVYGVTRHEAPWDTTNSEVDLLRVMIDQDKRRTAPKAKLP